MQAVFDMPVRADGAGEGLGVELGGGEIGAPLGLGSSGPFDAGLHHSDGSEMREARLVRVAAVGPEPVDPIGDDVAAHLDCTARAKRFSRAESRDIVSRLRKTR
jgi:hypothetical protein